MRLQTSQSSLVAPRNGNPAEPAEIWKARRFIHAHSDEALSLTAVAQFVHLSPNHLSDKFKEVTGTNFVNYIACTRTAKARERLLNSNLGITEIAFAVGFQSLSQFNRVFKKLAGKSPSAYRAMHGWLPLPLRFRQSCR